MNVEHTDKKYMSIEAQFLGGGLVGKTQKIESMEHQLQIVEANDQHEFIKVEFSKAELKRLYNVVFQKHEQDIEQGYTSDKIERLRAKLMYHLND